MSTAWNPQLYLIELDPDLDIGVAKKPVYTVLVTTHNSCAIPQGEPSTKQIDVQLSFAQLLKRRQS